MNTRLPGDVLDLTFSGLGDRRVFLKRAAGVGLTVPIAGLFGHRTAQA